MPTPPLFRRLNDLQESFKSELENAGLPPYATLGQLIEHHRVDAASTMLAMIQQARERDETKLNLWGDDP